MGKNVFRALRADEIDVRVQQVFKNENGGGSAVVLLYKDARVDMNLLDEHFGIYGWKREHAFKDNNNYCTVSVKNPETGEWIGKEDVGVESNTEATKGEASDAFKRACFNLGIGRELYTAPKTMIELDAREMADRNGKPTVKGWVRFEVRFIDTNADKTIQGLIITDQDGRVRYSHPYAGITGKTLSWFNNDWFNNPEGMQRLFEPCAEAYKLSGQMDIEAWFDLMMLTKGIDTTPGQRERFHEQFIKYIQK